MGKTYISKGMNRPLTQDELSRYIVLKEKISILWDDGEKWIPKPVETKILVPPEFLTDERKREDSSSKYWEVVKAEYEERGLIPPLFNPVEYYLSESISGVRDVTIDELTKEEIELVLEYYSKDKRSTTLEEKLRIAERGQISSALAGGIARRREPTLFDDLEEEKGLSIMESDSANYVDRKGRNIALTKSQTKIIYALSHYLSQYQNDEDIRKYISAIEQNPKKLPKEKIERPVNLREFYKTYLSSYGSSRKRDIDLVREELRKLSSIRQVLYFGSGTESKVRLISPLISIEEELEDLTPDKSLDMDLVNIRFSPLFLFKMTREYLPIGRKLFQIWGRKGNGTDTELFSILLSDLAEKYPRYRQTAITRTHAVNRKDFPSKEDYNKELDRVRKSSLTYIQNVSTFLERCTTDYYSTRQYKANFRKDLEQACKVLSNELGLISEGKVIKNRKGEDSIKIVFNFDYMSD